MNVSLAVSLACALAISAGAQGSGGPIPRFEDYPVAGSGKEVRTNLLLPKPNFAGTYALIRWECGSKCLAAAILDVRTATVYYPPLSGNDTKYSMTMDPTSDRNVGFRIDSSLLILERACQHMGQNCGTYYFNWKANHFDLVTWTTSGADMPSLQRAVILSHLPRFDEYRVQSAFEKKAVAPKFTKAEERRFRTAIRNGVRSGERVRDGETGDPAAGPGPNFAGHYTIVEWGCGTDCGEMAIVDAKTGRIFQPPFAGSRSSYFSYPTRFSMPPQFRLASRLFIMPDICADNVAVCGTYYFVFENNRWREIHREPLPPDVMQPFY